MKKAKPATRRAIALKKPVRQGDIIYIAHPLSGKPFPMGIGSAIFDGFGDAILSVELRPARSPEQVTEVA